MMQLDHQKIEARRCFLRNFSQLILSHFAMRLVFDPFNRFPVFQRTDVSRNSTIAPAPNVVSGEVRPSGPLTNATSQSQFAIRLGYSFTALPENKCTQNQFLKIMTMQSDIGLIGLAVMGENLALNMESKGFSVAVFNRTTAVTEKFAATRGKGEKSRRPRQSRNSSAR